MNSPCEECITRACCINACGDSIMFSNKLDEEIKKVRRFIISKNGHQRKHIPRQKLKYYNHLVTKWNKHITISNVIVDRGTKMYRQTAKWFIKS